MRRALIVVLEKIDEALDQVLYRPAVVRAFLWVPRWWLCDLAKLSIWLDKRWSTGWWEEEGIEPGGPRQACGRRGAIHVLGGPGPGGEHFDDFLETHPVYLCGWCPIPGSPCWSSAALCDPLGLVGVSLRSALRARGENSTLTKVMVYAAWFSIAMFAVGGLLAVVLVVWGALR